MKRIERVYCIADLLVSHVGNEYSFADLMVIASEFIKLLRKSDKVLHRHESEPPGLNEAKDLVDAFKTPFEILEREFGNMRLGEASGWTLNQEVRFVNQEVGFATQSTSDIIEELAEQYTDLDFSGYDE